MEKRTFTILEKNKGMRLDKFLAHKNDDLSRTYLQKLIVNKKVIVNGGKVQNSYSLNTGDRVILSIPPPEEPEIAHCDMDLNIIYEDEDIIVLNKKAGVIVHPVPGNNKSTLVNGLLAYVDNLSGIGGVKRPGIVHRLDKDTSGALVVAKNDKSHRKLVNQFKERKVKKIYRALVKGKLSYKKGKIDAPIGRNPENRTKMAVTKKNSKKAVTLFTVKEFLGDYTLLEIELKTGRTHQIRVHFSHIGYPIVGDRKYGDSKASPRVKRQLLHASKLGLYHPGSGEWSEFTAKLPADFKNFISEHKKKA